MCRILTIGDVHVVPQELADCEALLRLIVETVEKHGIEEVIFLGDQFNCHNVLDSRVVSFWNDVIHYRLPRGRQTYLIGNHDFAAPSKMMPHSMVPHKLVEHVTVIDNPQQIRDLPYCAMPYYYNPIEFVEEAVKLKAQNESCNILFCHQTFTGADQGLGFYAKDAVDPSAVPFKIIISGHIHKPMRLGKVFYPGAPRWRTLTDAEVENRNIYILEPGKSPVAIPTNTHCTRIYRFEDSENEQAGINLSSDELSRADIRVTINGTSDYISKRMLELKAKYNARCRGVPTRSRLTKVSESEGIEKAFNRFAQAFTPPNGTDRIALMKEAYARM